MSHTVLFASTSSEVNGPYDIEDRNGSNTCIAYLTLTPLGKVLCSDSKCGIQEECR